MNNWEAGTHISSERRFKKTLFLSMCFWCLMLLFRFFYHAMCVWTIHTQNFRFVMWQYWYKSENGSTSISISWINSHTLRICILFFKKFLENSFSNLEFHHAESLVKNTLFLIISSIFLFRSSLPGFFFPVFIYIFFFNHSNSSEDKKMRWYRMIIGIIFDRRMIMRCLNK